MSSVNFRQANRFGLNHILSGSNQATEGMRFPENWNWLKLDKRNIISIAKKSGIKKFITFPSIGIIDFVWHSYFKNIRWISFLDFIDFNKEEAIKDLEANFGYKRYPYKHYESIFTRFYQGYILPKKFGIDKRKLHLSTLIASGQITRDESIKILKEIPYPSQNDLNIL